MHNDKLTFNEDTVLALVAAEFVLAKKFPDFHSEHEGYAVIKEEVDELWDAIKNNKHTEIHERLWEAIQVAAMAVKYVASLAPPAFLAAYQLKKEE